MGPWLGLHILPNAVDFAHITGVFIIVIFLQNFVVFFDLFVYLLSISISV